MISVVYTRPMGWERCGDVEATWVPLCGPFPRRTNGKPAGDGIGAVALPEMVDVLERVLAELKPDVFFRDVHQKFDAEMMARCRRVSPNTVWAMTEGNEPWTVSRYVARLREFVDVVFINNENPQTIEDYGKLGVRVVPCWWDGYHPKDHARRPHQEAEHDCFFGGSNRMIDGEWEFPFGRSRYEFINLMNDAVDLDLHGSVKEWVGMDPAPVLAHGPYLAAMQNAKVVLGHNAVDLPRYYTRRTIHSIASGRPYVVRYIPGMEKDFAVGCGVYTFETKEEALEIVDVLMSDDDVYLHAASAVKRMAEGLTWQARFERFAKVAPWLLEGGRVYQWEE